MSLEAVLEHKADIGLSFDGNDAKSPIVVDEQGNVLDGITFCSY